MNSLRSAGLAFAALLLGAAAPASVDHARMLAPDPGQWLSVGRTYDEQRFSPLAHINDGNVGSLGRAWVADLATERGMEASPLAIHSWSRPPDPSAIAHKPNTNGAIEAGMNSRTASHSLQALMSENAVARRFHST